MAFTSRIVVRFADIDWARVVYFARFFDYAHRTFEDFFNVDTPVSYARLLEEHHVGFPIVHSEANFRSPLRLGDTARIVMQVVKLSSRSVTTTFTFFRGETDESCAQLTLKQAAINTTSFTAIAMPPAIEAQLRRHLGNAE
jgi:4-hydroxybenzoyl-CoA thioesterase